MKKAWIWLLTALMLLTLVAPAMADDTRKSGDFTYRIKGNGTAAITGYDWKAMEGKDIFIPRMLDGYTVTEIGAESFAAFEYDDNGFAKPQVILEAGSLVIPETVTIIGEKAFWGISFKTKVINIPGSVEYIGAGAFSNIEGIEQFSVASSNPVYATIDGVLYNKRDKTLVAFPPEKGVAYKGNSYLAEFSIPHGIKHIEDYAFFDVRYKSVDGFKVSASGVAFPDSLETIGDFAFAYFGEPHWTESNYPLDIVFPSLLKEMGTGAFYKFEEEISSLNMGASQINEISPYAFYACELYKLETPMLLPSNLSIIGEYAFAENHLFYLTIPASVVEIRSFAFQRGIYLFDELKFESNAKLQIIGDGAFSANSWHNVTLKLPAQLKSIGANAFSVRGADEVYPQSIETLIVPASVTSLGDNFCDKESVYLDVEPGSYAALYASENGYMTKVSGAEDTSWLN